MIKLRALAAAAALLAASCGEPPPPTGQAPITVLERSCLYPDDAELATPWMAEGPGGLLVELWCGTRVEVSGGICRVRLGDELTEVPCIDPAAMNCPPPIMQPAIGNTPHFGRDSFTSTVHW